MPDPRNCPYNENTQLNEAIAWHEGYRAGILFAKNAAERVISNISTTGRSAAQEAAPVNNG